MEKKNMVLLTVIAVATLLVAVVGATFAYFTASIQNDYNDQGNNGTANISSGSVGSNTTVVAEVDGQAGSFEATDVYPGHKEVAALKVTVEGDTAQSIDITYSPTTNDFPDGSITLKVYKGAGSENIGEEDSLTSETGTYYVVVEFVNKPGESQDTAQSKTLDGDISVRLTP